MKKFTILGTVAGMAILGASVADAETHILIRRDTVMPIVFEDTLTLKSNHVGDRFCAKIDESLDLPWGTRFVGHVESIKPPHDGRAGFMDLRFDEIQLPDGERIRIAGAPVILSDRRIKRDRDGRLIAVRDDTDRENMVLGGALGGFVIGSAIKKPLEGALIGAIAGIFVAENDKRKNGDTIVQKGARMGLMVDETIDFRWRGDFRRDRAIEPDRPSRGRRGTYDPDDDVRRDPAPRRRGDDRRPDLPSRRELPPRREPPVENVVDVRYKDKSIAFDAKEAPFWDGDVMMVALRACSYPVGLKIEDGRANQFYVNSDEGTLRIQVGEKTAKWNGDDVELSRPIVERDGVIFVPQDALRLLRHDGFEFRGNPRG